MIWRAADQIARRAGEPGWIVEEAEIAFVDPYVFAEARLYEGRYEVDEMRLACELVYEADLCIDIGANIGPWTMLLAHLTGPLGLVHAFEPSPPARDRLGRSVGGLPNVVVHQEAVGARPGRMEIVIAPGDSMLSTLRSTGPHVPGYTGDVDVLPLTAFVTNAEIGFLKVDVEGFEADVLEGMWPLIMQGRIRAMLWEVAPDFAPTEWVRRLLDAPLYRGYALERQHGASFRHRLSFSDPDVALRQAKAFSFVVLREDARL